ncbi:hypothetical protein OSB04_019416 [Centaurea solstitialis]|uniref:Uncharacterized protein n=1 Tax=Centaurea solstitialis TaxID=347529 RepID=A0AA38SXY0_9ASTR|nr:hypothetical protein OSB04_019416 [Centaurea solstitialis]
MELHGMLKTAESNMAKSKPAAPVLAIREGGIKKKKKAAPVKGKGKGKAIQPNPKPKTKGQGKAQSDIPQSKTPEDAVCFHCKEVGHWRRTCPKYLEELKKLKANGASTSGTYMIELHSTSASNSWVLDTGCGTHICTNVQGLKRSRKVRRGELDLIMGNKQIASVDMIGNYELSFSSGLSVVLIDCCYSAEMARNIISFYALYKDGFDFGFDNGSILVYKNNVLYFKANPCHGIYETSITDRDNRSSIYNVESTQSKNGLDKSYLWHCRLGHISKKRITKLQSDGILESFDHTSNDECESCLLGKMTKAPFTGTCERGKDLLDIVHTDVCGPFKSATRHGERYFVTFTDDFSRYGYVYLIKHKSETIEVFRTFQNEVENQLNRKIKTLRSDRGGEYLSQEFRDHLRSCGIIAQLTPPRTPQHNGVAERRNRTLLDMVRSMMIRTALPISFWGYALETAARVLNLVPTKKVSKTPSEIWSGEVPSLEYLKVWGCEAYVRREAQDKLEPRSERCYFVGYPTNSFGYLFYKPSENKVFVARMAWFLEKELISKETSGSQIDLEEIQESTSMETDVGTSSQQQVVEPIVVEPQQRVTEESDIQPPPLRRSDRVRHAPERYNLLISDGDDTQVDLDEPTSYQEAMAGPEAAKWKEAMESEMQSMYDNQVWDLVDHIPSLKIVGHKWVFKKKTNMDGKVHTYKARLVAKGYTQTHGVDYDETFSPVAMLKSIRILIAIAAFHDYEIWQMDVKTAFLNGKLSEDVYMTQPEGFVQSEHPNRVCKLQKSIYGLKQASRSWNICFDEKVKEFGFLRSEDEPCVYVRTSGSIVVFLVLYVDDILLMGNDIPTLQSVKTWLGKCFSMKDMGDAAYILGIKIYRDRSRRLIGLSQSTYIDKVLKKFNMQDSKKGFIPMQHGLALSKAQCPSSNSELERMSRIPYASAIGSIMYAMICTRPDVSCALSMTSRYQANPGNDHWTAVKNILKYLRRTKEMFLVYGGAEELSVKGYTDASFQTDRDDSCSQSGFVFLLNGGAISWRSSKQSTVADSTTEAEYIAVNEAAKEAVWMKKFIGDLGVVPSIQDPIEIFCDNEGAVILAKEPRSHKRTRHILRKFHYVRKVVEDRDIIMSRVGTDENLADPFTKPLSQTKHDAHTSDIHGPLDDLVLTLNVLELVIEREQKEIDLAINLCKRKKKRLHGSIRLVAPQGGFSAGKANGLGGFSAAWVHGEGSQRVLFHLILMSIEEGFSMSRLNHYENNDLEHVILQENLTFILKKILKLNSDFEYIFDVDHFIKSFTDKGREYLQKRVWGYPECSNRGRLPYSPTRLVPEIWHTGTGYRVTGFDRGRVFSPCIRRGPGPRLGILASNRGPSRREDAEELHNTRFSHCKDHTRETLYNPYTRRIARVCFAESEGSVEEDVVQRCFQTIICGTSPQQNLFFTGTMFILHKTFRATIGAQTGAASEWLQ